MIDITGSKQVQVVIRYDRKVLWVNTAEGNCVLRICEIENLKLEDSRLIEKEIDIETCQRCKEGITTCRVTSDAGLNMLVCEACADYARNMHTKTRHIHIEKITKVN